MANIVLVVDMLRGFLEEDYPLYRGNRACRIIPNLRIKRVMLGLVSSA